MIQELRQHCPQTPIIVGGQAFMHGGSELLSRYKQVYYLKNLYELENYLRKQSNTKIYNTYSQKSI